MNALHPAASGAVAIGPRPGLSLRLLAEGERLLAAQRPAEALPLLRTAARSLGDGAAWLSLGEALMQLNDPAAAAEAAFSARAIEGETLAVLVLAGRALGRMGRPQEALAEAAQAVLLDRHDPAARLLLGQSLLNCGRHDEALAVLGELWREAPGDPWAALRLADGLMRAGSHDAAAELLAFILDSDAIGAPARAQALALRAQNALQRGAHAAALEAALAGLAETHAHAALHSIAGHALIKLGRLSEARPHLLTAHRLAPDDAYLGHLAASAGAFRPERADAAYVSHLFDGYAAEFEASLFSLGYRAPGLILRLLEALLPGLGPERKLDNLLDLGCGTGLVGVVMHDVVAGLIKGVDLSAAMLDQARAKGVYNQLQRAGIDEALAEDAGSWQAIVAADVFCYFGALEDTLAAITPRLAKDGWLVFTAEAMEGPEPWELAGSGRFRHSELGLRQALAGAGLTTVVLRREPLRLEGAVALEGFLVAARRAA
jgi:predicted TPR repeat methyltransferase